MAAFPTYLDYSWRDFSESEQSMVIRSEMDRGVPKQRRILSDTMVSVTINVHFRSKKQESDFMTWFDSAIGSGTDWFSWYHPRMETYVIARIVAGSLGPLKPDNKSWSTSQRSMTLEYLRKAY